MYNMVVRESLTKKVEFEQSFKRGKKVGEYLRWWSKAGEYRSCLILMYH